MRAALALLACLGVLAGCGSTGSRPARASKRCPTCAARIAQVRADTFASVASRLYHQEVFGTPNGAAFAQVARLAGLTRGLETGRPARARAALRGRRYAVRTRVVRRGRVLVDVGPPFVIAGAPRTLVAADGRRLGRIEVSIQAVRDFMRLVERLTGTEVVVRGSRDHHAVASLAAASAVSLPAAGRVAFGRRRFTVSSVRVAGFGGERLTIWILAPR